MPAAHSTASMPLLACRRCRSAPSVDAVQGLPAASQLVALMALEVLLRLHLVARQPLLDLRGAAEPRARTSWSVGWQFSAWLACPWVLHASHTCTAPQQGLHNAATSRTPLLGSTQHAIQTVQDGGPSPPRPTWPERAANGSRLRLSFSRLLSPPVFFFFRPDLAPKESRPSRPARAGCVRAEGSTR